MSNGSNSNGNPTGPSGVRNLRALFENKAGEDSISSPGRGRSASALSDVSSRSRPVSKVRASFFAVEKGGEQGQPPQWGLRQVEENMAETLAPMGDRQNGTYEEALANAPTAANTSESQSEQDPNSGLGAILKGSSFDGADIPSTSPEEKSTSDEPAPTQHANNEVGSSSETPESAKATLLDKQHRQEEPAPTSQPIPHETPRPRTEPSTPRTKTNTSKSPANGDPSPTSTRSPIKTPTSGNGKPRIRGGPGKILAVMESARKAQDERTAMASQAKTADGVTKADANQSKAPRPRTNGHPSSQPSSPKTTRSKNENTKAVRLPTAATASTAASAARSGSQPSSPKVSKTSKPTSQSGRVPTAATAATTSSAARGEVKPVPNAVQTKVTEKRNSNVRQAPKVASVGTASSLAKKTSRASMTSTSGDRPKSRVSTTKPDESFLSRMMRPTTSSTQKAHEKAQVSSPPRTRAAPTTKTKTQTKRPPRMSLPATQEAEKDENKENMDTSKPDLPEMESATPVPDMESNPAPSTKEVTQEPGMQPTVAESEKEPARHADAVPNGHILEKAGEVAESTNETAIPTIAQ